MFALLPRSPLDQQLQRFLYPDQCETAGGPANLIKFLLRRPTRSAAVAREVETQYHSAEEAEIRQDSGTDRERVLPNSNRRIVAASKLESKSNMPHPTQHPKSAAAESD